MNMDTRNAVAELILDALQHPEEATYLEIMDRYCHHVEKWNSLLVPLSKLRENITRKELAPLLHSELFKVYPLENPPDENHPHSEDSQYPMNATLCLDPDIEEDFRYLSNRTHIGHKIIELLRKEPIPKNTHPIEAGVIRASYLFNHGLYFETHEILEEIWLEEVGNVRPFLQGIIQVAVGFHHLHNGNYNGAVSLIRDGANKLRPYSPVYHRLDVQSFLEGVDKCRERLSQLNRDTVGEFDSALIPEMKMIQSG